MGMFDSIFGGGGGNVGMPDPKDYLPLIQGAADINRLDQSTPFGGTRYVQPEAPQAMGYNDWLGQNPVQPQTGFDDGTGNRRDSGYSLSEDRARQKQAASSGRSGYDSYLQDFNANNPAGQPTVESYLSPELQSIFNKQFSTDAYNQYGDDYMANAERYLNPIYDKQSENLEQTMANRGQPVGGELYDDTYGNLMDAQNKGWENAAFGATQAGDQARLQDFNRLMAAMGQNTIPVPQIDTMGPANMAMNANMANVNSANQNSSNIWNTGANLGAAWLMGG